jgi:hypothetical protein
MAGAFLLITEDGPHPPETWAGVTADQIIDIAETAEETRAAEARRFREELVKLLVRHHEQAQEHERVALKEHGHARLMHAERDEKGEHQVYSASTVKNVIGAIVSMAGGYSFEEHFHKPETQAYLHEVLARNFATQAHIERSWHADKHPNTKEAKEFRKLHHPGPTH